jgi:hypothetical protein
VVIPVNVAAAVLRTVHIYAGQNHNTKDTQQILCKSGEVQTFGNNNNKSKLHSERNKNSLNLGTA